MKILVTGGTGVIGAAAIPELLRAGHTVRLLSRHADEDAPAFPDGVETFPADIGEPLELAGAAAARREQMMLGMVVAGVGKDADANADIGAGACADSWRAAENAQIPGEGERSTLRLRLAQLQL